MQAGVSPGVPEEQEAPDPKVQFSQLTTPDGSALRRLDIRVFVCMLECVKAEAHMSHLAQVQLKVLAPMVLSWSWR